MNKNERPRTSLVIQWLRLCAPSAEVGFHGWVPSLVGEVRSHMLCGAKKKNTEQSGGHLTIGRMKEVRPREKRCIVLEGVEDK